MASTPLGRFGGTTRRSIRTAPAAGRSGERDQTSPIYTRYNNPRVNELVETGAIERDQDARRSIYFEIQKLVYEEVAQIGLFYRPYRNGYSPRVENLIMNPAIQFNLVDARLRDE